MAHHFSVRSYDSLGKYDLACIFLHGSHSTKRKKVEEEVLKFNIWP